MLSRTGGQLVVDTLQAHGVTIVFGVPGESHLAVLDALHDVPDEVRYVPTRHEGGAAFMAEAWGKLTGCVGVCLVTRGPGATNASIGVHTAAQDSTPMILLIGQVGTPHRDREAFQEIDYHGFYGGIAKAVFEVDHVDHTGELLAEAIEIAQSGRPGPVVVSLPEDQLVAVSDAASGTPRQIAAPSPSAAEMQAVVSMIESAERPLMLLGGGRWTGTGRADAVDFAEQADVPAVVAFRFHDLFDNTSGCYAGEAGVARLEAVRTTITEADLILAVGVRFGEMTTDAWRLLDVPRPTQRILHAHPSARELGRIYEPDIAIESTPDAMMAALHAAGVTPSRSRSDWRASRRRAFLESLACPPQRGELDMGRVSAWLRDHLPDDVIVTNGAGNYTVWPNKFLLYGPRARLLAPQSGAMGYGLPAAIAARAAFPGRTVVCFAGDGDLQMSLPELGTAAQEGLQPIVLVVDNAMYGTIRAHQEQAYPGRVLGTDLVNPDFVALARVYGFHAERVTNTAEFPDAFHRAQASTTGALLHLVVDPTLLTPYETIDQARSL